MSDPAAAVPARRCRGGREAGTLAPTLAPGAGTPPWVVAVAGAPGAPGLAGRSMGDRRACMVERRLGGAMMAWMYLAKRKGGLGDDE